MEFFGFLFELIFLGIGLYFYLLLSDRITLKGVAGQNLQVFKQNAGMLKVLSLVLSLLGGMSLILHLAQFLKK